MRKILFNYSYKRNFWEATVFYIVSLIYLSVFALITAFFIFLLRGQDRQLLQLITPTLRGIFVFALSLFVLKKRNLLSFNKWFGLAVVAGMSAYANAGFAGLLITSFLTTR